jgi:regulator of RNase E activity RraA
MTGNGKIGFRIVPGPPRVDPELLERFRGVPAANLADAMGRFNFMDPGIALRSGVGLCGGALTVRTRPGDNLMVHKAMELARPGDVVVVNTGENRTTAVFGELMCRTALGAKVGGIVVDGAIRDVEAIRALGFPAYSRAVSIGSCDKDGPGEINVPIACGGTVVMPGDIVVGDCDGVAVVPREEAANVLEQVLELMEREKKRTREIEGGLLFKSEIDETLRKKGVLS